ncbi:hypothetical protein Pelo_19211 [Pelomyxa schiedti]|nr:hypothetical protein Pelo_19211 [Pelomyxa schiedti]
MDAVYLHEGVSTQTQQVFSYLQEFVARLGKNSYTYEFSSTRQYQPQTLQLMANPLQRPPQSAFTMPTLFP